MASRNVEWFYFKGKGSWLNKLFTPDMEYGSWQAKLHFDADSLVLFNKLREVQPDGSEGILNELKMDVDGDFIVFKRPVKKEYKDKNNVTQVIHFDPPVVVDKDNNPWNKQVAIGNGSDITVKVERYKYRKPFNKGFGTAIRMASVRVENLVPYGKDSLTEGQQHQLAGMENQPVHDPF